MLSDAGFVKPQPITGASTKENKSEFQRSKDGNFPITVGFVDKYIRVCLAGKINKSY